MCFKIQYIMIDFEVKTKEIQCFIDEIHKSEEEDQKNRHLMMINSSISEFLIK